MLVRSFFEQAHSMYLFINPVNAGDNTFVVSAIGRYQLDGWLVTWVGKRLNCIDVDQDIGWQQVAMYNDPITLCYSITIHSCQEKQEVCQQYTNHYS
jgi:hypothetical protein